MREQVDSAISARTDSSPTINDLCVWRAPAVELASMANVRNVTMGASPKPTVLLASPVLLGMRESRDPAKRAQHRSSQTSIRRHAVCSQIVASLVGTRRCSTLLEGGYPCVGKSALLARRVRRQSKDACVKCVHRDRSRLMGVSASIVIQATSPMW